jgi:hypothetical protein
MKCSAIPLRIHPLKFSGDLVFFDCQPSHNRPSLRNLLPLRPFTRHAGQKPYEQKIIPRKFSDCDRDHTNSHLKPGRLEFRIYPLGV